MEGNAGGAKIEARLTIVVKAIVLIMIRLTAFLI